MERVARVLVVEDDENHQLLVRLLQAHGAYEVAVAGLPLEDDRARMAAAFPRTEVMSKSDVMKLPSETETMLSSYEDRLGRAGRYVASRRRG